MKKKVVTKKKDSPKGTISLIISNGEITNAVANLSDLPTEGRYVVEFTPTNLVESEEFAKRGSEEKRILMLPSCDKIWDFSEGVVSPFYNSAFRDS
jgi:hypothetical protein